jgi:hypothetical protein
MSTCRNTELFLWYLGRWWNSRPSAPVGGSQRHPAYFDKNKTAVKEKANSFNRRI